MTLAFPDDFHWGTSTAAAQIETASDHQFRGLRARDGYLFERTTDHERRRLADVDLIARFGSVYRCGVDWARLQSRPFAAFSRAVVGEYRELFAALGGRGVRVMLVLHHFAHPRWFEEAGGFDYASNLTAFYDYCARCAEAFGDLVYAWNTFNEPNVYALNAYQQGIWPPYRKSVPAATRVLGHMARAHVHVYELLKGRFPGARVGYSLNTAYAEGRGLRGEATARFFDWWFYRRPVKLFRPVDFVGISYYAHLVFNPDPLTATEHAGELERRGLPHDRMWALKPEGLAYFVRRAHRDTGGQPVWVTENGVCTDDPQFRIRILEQYLTGLHGCIREGIPVLGYTHWSPWDNFEWDLGPTYRFGLLHLDLATMERHNTPAADWYERVCDDNALQL